MKKGNCHRALKDWKERGGERRGEERKKGKVARKEGQEKRKREKRQKVHGFPLGLEPRPVAVSRPPSCRRGHRVAGDWGRKIGHTALPRAGGCARDWPPISGVTNTTDPACPERMGESPWPGWPTVSKT